MLAPQFSIHKMNFQYRSYQSTSNSLKIANFHFQYHYTEELKNKKFKNIKFETHNQSESQASFSRGLLQLELRWEVDSASCSGFDGKGKSRRASRGLPWWYSGSAGENGLDFILWSGNKVWLCKDWKMFSS